MRVTCLSNDDQTGHHATDENTQMNNFMVTALRNMDYSMFEKPFTSEGHGAKKRLVHGNYWFYFPMTTLMLLPAL